MPRVLKTCAECHRERTRGSSNPDGGTFICDNCEADADQFIAIQDSIYEPNNAGRSSGGPEPC